MNMPWGGGGQPHTDRGERWLPAVATTEPTDKISFRHQSNNTWLNRTAIPKVYVNGAWVVKRPKRWDGSAWVDLA